MSIQHGQKYVLCAQSNCNNAPSPCHSWNTNNFETNFLFIAAALTSQPPHSLSCLLTLPSHLAQPPPRTHSACP